MINSVDVIIPTYMETDRLAEAVSSCKNQTHPPEKIIIVDDGSDSSTQVWLKEQFSSDSRVHLILASHSGLPGVARSIGIETSTANWLAFLDADDSWQPEKLDLQLKYAHKNHAQFIGTNAIAIRQDQSEFLLLTNPPQRINFRDLVRTNWVINSSVLIKSELLKEKHKYADDVRVRAVEDYATWLRIATDTQIHIMSSSLTNYNMSEQSIRSIDVIDPRVHAFADFLIWAQAYKPYEKRKMKKFKKLVLRQIVKQYGN